MKKTVVILAIILLAFNGYFISNTNNEDSALNLLNLNSIANAQTEIGGEGTCGYKLWAYGQWQIECNVNYSTVMWVRSMWPEAEFYWCCDSCGESSYCGDA